MQLGASLRFVYPSDAVATDRIDFREAEKNLPPGGFLNTPAEDFRPRRQAANTPRASKWPGRKPEAPSRTMHARPTGQRRRFRPAREGSRWRSSVVRTPASPR